MKMRNYSADTHVRLVHRLRSVVERLEKSGNISEVLLGGLE